MYDSCSVLVVSLVIMLFQSLEAKPQIDPGSLSDADFLDLISEAGHNTGQQVIDIPTEEECGLSFSDRIVGGQIAARGSWPWLAAIGENVELIDGHGFKLFCAGTLITRQHVISAATCFSHERTGTIVRLGEYNINEDGDGAIDFSIVEQRVKNYNRQTKENDIIVLKLDRPIDVFKDNIRAACLPYHLSNDNFEGKSLTTVGWGRFDNNRPLEFSPIPLQVDVPVVPVKECKLQYEGLPGTSTINEKQICAGKTGSDSCGGDGGAPLNYRDFAKGRFYLVGFVSFGPTLCGSERFPSVYTRVDQHLPWIERSIKEMQ